MTEVLCGGFLVDDYKPELIDMVLSKLVPEQVRIAVIGKKFDGSTDQTERWYGTQYSLNPIPDETINVSSIFKLLLCYTLVASKVVRFYFDNQFLL